MTETATSRGKIESVDDFTQNPYITNGCEIEGHENQQLQFIFLRKKNDTDSLFGCSYCVAQRIHKGCKLISLIQALKTKHRQSIFKFPELDQKIESEVKKAIDKSNELAYNQEIDNIFDNLQDRLKDEVQKIEEQAMQLIGEIKGKGDEMKETFTKITNCDQIRECFETSSTYDELHSNFNDIIKSIYDKSGQNNEEIKQKTKQYNDKLSTFVMEFSEKLSKKVLEAIKKISFEKQDNIKMVQSIPAAYRVEKDQYLKKQIAGHSYNQEILQLQQQELGGNFKKGYQPMEISVKSDSLQTFTMGECNKRFLNQIFSQPLDNQKTYKIFFSIKNYSSTSTFSIGLGDYSKNSEALLTTSKCSKVFNPQKEYEGLTFVEYGSDVSKCYGDNQVFIFKCNISKSYAKIQTGDKASSNTFENNVTFDQSIKYCFFVLNQSPNFQIEITKVVVKQNQ
ncbi:hypothetical protein ABPG72_008905 [Tetrahymena utriculariae]